jgi:hypothetical protein
MILWIIIPFQTTSCNHSKGEFKRNLKSFSIQDSIHLDLPLKRFQFTGNDAVVYDFYSKSIFKIDRDFEITDTLGRWGDGPQENLLVRNFSFLNDNRVAIIDTQKNTFKVQDFNDSIYYYHKFEKIIDRGVYLGPKELFLSGIGQKMKYNFNLFNLENASYVPVENLDSLFNEPNSALIYEGKISNDKSLIVHTSYFADHWFIYNYKTKDIKVGKYIHTTPKPNVLELPGAVMLDNAIEVIVDSFIYNNSLMIISNVSEKRNPKQRVLDVYDLNTLKYQYSYQLPILNSTVPNEGFHMAENKIGLMYEDKCYIIQLDN